MSVHVANPIRIHRQAGVSLIEVMVAVLVLSLGLMGAAALLAVSLANNNRAMTESMGTVSSYSIMDAMRGDLASARAGNYNQTVSTTACPQATSGNMPSLILHQWCVDLKANMGPASKATGTVDCAPSGSQDAFCTVKVVFDNSRTGGSSQQTIYTKGML